MLKKIASNLKSRVVAAPVPITLREINAVLNGPRVLSNSIPKAGTHLTERVLKFSPSIIARWKKEIPTSSIANFQSKLKFVNGQYMVSHLYWSKGLSEYLRYNSIKVIFTIRDIRDVAVSRAYYYTDRLTLHPAHQGFRDLANNSDRLLYSIRGDRERYVTPFQDMMEGYLPWLDDPNCLVVKFEDLIGSDGGGSDIVQLETTRKIFDFIGATIDDQSLSEISRNVYSRSANTFRRGIVSSWREEFGAHHKEEFKREANDFLVALGYEADNLW